MMSMPYYTWEWMWDPVTASSIYVCDWIGTIFAVRAVFYFFFRNVDKPGFVDYALNKGIPNYARAFYNHMLQVIDECFGLFFDIYNFCDELEYIPITEKERMFSSEEIELDIMLCSLIALYFSTALTGYYIAYFCNVYIGTNPHWILFKPVLLEFLRKECPVLFVRLNEFFEFDENTWAAPPNKKCKAVSTFPANLAGKHL